MRPGRNPYLALTVLAAPVPSSAAKRDPALNLCPRCLYWDRRPEDGLGHLTGYCTQKEIITSYVTECKFYERATPDRIRQKAIELYGELETEEGEGGPEEE